MSSAPEVDVVQPGRVVRATLDDEARRSGYVDCTTWTRSVSDSNDDDGGPRTTNSRCRPIIDCTADAIGNRLAAGNGTYSSGSRSERNSCRGGTPSSVDRLPHPAKDEEDIPLASYVVCDGRDDCAQIRRHNVVGSSCFSESAVVDRAELEESPAVEDDAMTVWIEQRAPPSASDTDEVDRSTAASPSRAMAAVAPDNDDAFGAVTSSHDVNDALLLPPTKTVVTCTCTCHQPSKFPLCEFVLCSAVLSVLLPFLGIPALFYSVRSQLAYRHGQLVASRAANVTAMRLIAAGGVCLCLLAIGASVLLAASVFGDSSGGGRGDAATARGAGSMFVPPPGRPPPDAGFAIAIEFANNSVLAGINSNNQRPGRRDDVRAGSAVVDLPEDDRLNSEAEKSSIDLQTRRPRRVGEKTNDAPVVPLPTATVTIGAVTVNSSSKSARRLASRRSRP